MSELEILQELKVLRKLKKATEIKIAKHKQDIEAWDGRIKEIQSNCKHDFEHESVWYLEQYTCKTCGLVEIW
jgi:hypothetical protein